MKEREIFFEILKRDIDDWSKGPIENIESSEDFRYNRYEMYKNEYIHLQKLLRSTSYILDFQIVLEKALRGTMDSILTMLDGEDELANEFNIDLINEDTGKSLKEGVKLREEFINYLRDIDKKQQKQID